LSTNRLFSLVRAVDRQLLEELTKLRVVIDEDKSHVADLKKEKNFSLPIPTQTWRPPVKGMVTRDVSIMCSSS
jgi:hypothetical protein